MMIIILMVINIDFNNYKLNSNENTIKNILLPLKVLEKIFLDSISYIICGNGQK